VVSIKTSGEQKQRQTANSPMACAHGRTAPAELPVQVLLEEAFANMRLCL
jgi:hypothetical protein